LEIRHHERGWYSLTAYVCNANQELVPVDRNVVVVISTDTVVGQVTRLDLKLFGIRKSFRKKELLHVAGDLEFFAKRFLFQLLPRQLFIFDGNDNNVAESLNESQGIFTVKSRFIIIDTAHERDGEVIPLMRYGYNDIEFREFGTIVRLKARDAIQRFEVVGQLDSQKACRGAKIYLAVPFFIQDIEGQLPDAQVGPQGEVVYLIERFLRHVTIDRLRHLKQGVQFELLDFVFVLKGQLRHAVNLTVIRQ